MRKVCKCHGLSGSCTLKTCWLKMPIFRDVGDILVRNYDSASKVTVSNDGRRLLTAGSQSDRPTGKNNLVYSSESPDYCQPNRKLGSLGTGDRSCEPGLRGVGGCDHLCCGRGYRHETVTVYENCKCTFEWCCTVKCETCINQIEVNRCN